MDRIWAESQLALKRQGAGNTTNFSTVSATAQTEMGSTKVQAASNEQLLPFSVQSCQGEECELLLPPPPNLALFFGLNAEECM